MNSNAKVVNIGVGNNTSSDGTTTIAHMIDALVLNGICVVVAAGNSGAANMGDIASADTSR